MKYFKTIEDLQKYSDIRFTIRFENSRIYRREMGVLNNLLAKHSPESICKTKDDDKYEILNKEKQFREIIKSLKLPVSSKIL